MTHAKKTPSDFFFFQNKEKRGHWAGTIRYGPVWAQP